MKQNAIKTNEDSMRKPFFNEFAYLKRCIRLLLPLKSKITALRIAYRRRKKKLELIQSPFDRYRIAALSDSIVSLDMELIMIDELLAGYGFFLMNLCEDSDEVMSLHDKAQILGGNFVDAKRAECECEAKSIPLFELIFVHKIEYRGKDEIIPDALESMPLWNAALCAFMKIARRPDGKEKMREGLGIFFPELPRYNLYEFPDGTKSLLRIAPQFKLIEGGKIRGWDHQDQ